MWVMYIYPTGKEDTPYWSWFNANEYYQQKEGTSLHASDCLNTMTAGPLALSSSGLHSSGMTWLALFTLLMNYSLILAYHPITCLFSTNSATMLMPSDIIYSWHHHALSNKNILKSWLLSAVQISWFVYHLVSLAKFTHTTEANILLG